MCTCMCVCVVVYCARPCTVRQRIVVESTVAQQGLIFSFQVGSRFFLSRFVVGHTVTKKINIPAVARIIIQTSTNCEVLIKNTVKVQNTEVAGYRLVIM